MHSDLKKFYDWLSRRRKLMGVQWKEVYASSNLSKTTVTDVVHHDGGNTNNRDRVAIVFGFNSWNDLQRAYRSGMFADEDLPRQARHALDIAPARLAEQFARFASADAEKYREQVFRNLTPSAVADISKVFNDRLTFYMKGKS